MFVFVSSLFGALAAAPAARADIPSPPQRPTWDDPPAPLPAPPEDEAWRWLVPLGIAAAAAAGAATLRLRARSVPSLAMGPQAVPDSRAPSPDRAAGSQERGAAGSAA